MDKYDSRLDTQDHVNRVRELLYDLMQRLNQRALVHDKSKFEEPEITAFDYATPRLKNCTYGSEEYKGFLADLKPALDHHYAQNSHHPEHYPWHCPICQRSYSEDQVPRAQGCDGVDGGDHRFCPNCCPESIIWEAELDWKPGLGINGMSLLDVIEMLCDWKAAGERHADGSIKRSLEVNKDRFSISPQLQSILENTVRELGWKKP